MQHQEFDPKSYWESRLSRSYNLEGVGFKRLGEAYNKYLYAVRDKVFSLLAKKLPINWTESLVEEIGPGTGFYTERFRALGVKNLRAVDISETACSNLRLRFPEYEFFASDYSDFSDPMGKKFDLVASFDVLFHIVNEEKYRNTIRCAAERLRKGGYFVFSDNLGEGGRRQQHYVGRNEAEVFALCRKHGLDLVLKQPMFVVMNSPARRGGLFNTIWRIVFLPVMLFPILGSIYGRLLLPLELRLIQRVENSPSTVIYVFQKQTV